MSKSVLHAVSTREPYAIPSAIGPRGDIGPGMYCMKHLDCVHCTQVM